MEKTYFCFILENFGQCEDVEYSSDCCQVQDVSCNLECKKDRHCRYSTWVLEKQDSYRGKWQALTYFCHEVKS